jgi:hypothetical protein
MLSYSGSCIVIIASLTSLRKENISALQLRTLCPVASSTVQSPVQEQLLLPKLAEGAFAFRIIYCIASMQRIQTAVND